MKKLSLILLLTALCCLEAMPAPGDTTVVQTIEFTDSPPFGCRVGKYLFPDTSVSYERVLMYYTLKCDMSRPSPYYCGEWDYIYDTELLEPANGFDTIGRLWEITIHGIPMTVRMDTVKIFTDSTQGRVDLHKANYDPITQRYHFTFYDTTADVDTLNPIATKLYNKRYNIWALGTYITPYGYGIDLGEGWTWVYDVSDFIPLLKDSVIIQDCNGQELLDLKFLFIEGTPLREVIDIRKVWMDAPTEGWGGYALKNFDNIVRDTTIQLNANQKQVKLRTTVTGHAMEPNGTGPYAEFSANTHSVYANGQLIREWQIIQSCSENPLQPQGGTWIYPRAGWCPGAVGTTNEFELTPYIDNNSIRFDYNIEYAAYGYYRSRFYLVTYGESNQRTDVAMESVIAPSDNPLLSSPTCSRPIVVIRNAGTETLTSVDIAYGIARRNTDVSVMNTYQWSGNLPPMTKDTVELPLLDWREVGDTTEALGIFMIELSEPNHVADPTPHNNRMYSTFKMPKLLTIPRIRVELKTNKNSGETSWFIFDALGNVVHKSELSLAPQTVYTSNLTMANGCYRFTIEDTGGDGLAFWHNPDAGTGHLRLQRGFGSSGYADMKTFTDFGSSASYEFAINTFLNVEEIPQNQAFKLYPNPAESIINVLTSPLAVPAELFIYDIRGVLIHGETVQSESLHTVSVANYPSGVYIVVLKGRNQILGRSKFVIVK
jgi:hypothetical protein